MVRHSGEIPEIALHSALYFLTEDPDGPRLQLSVQEVETLQDAAICRYQEIIRRDLCFANRALPMYRGVRRAIFNWRRFVAFCQRQDAAALTLTRSGVARRPLQEQIEIDRRATAEALLQLVQETRQPGESKAMTGGRPSAGAIPGADDTGPSIACGRPSSIPGTDDTGPSMACVFNCTHHEFTIFARELGLTEQLWPHDIDFFRDQRSNHQLNNRSTEINKTGEEYALCKHPGSRQVKQGSERKYLQGSNRGHFPGSGQTA